jgi:hypothetical protein
MNVIAHLGVNKLIRGGGSQKRGARVARRAIIAHLGLLDSMFDEESQIQAYSIQEGRQSHYKNKDSTTSLQLFFKAN